MIRKYKILVCDCYLVAVLKQSEKLDFCMRLYPTILGLKQGSLLLFNLDATLI